MDDTEYAHTDVNLNDDTWYHVGIAYDASDSFADIFVNGVAVLHDDSSSDGINIAGDYNGGGTQK